MQLPHAQQNQTKENKTVDLCIDCALLAMHKKHKTPTKTKMNTYTFTKNSEIFSTEAFTYGQALEDLINHISSRYEVELALWIYRGE